MIFRKAEIELVYAPADGNITNNPNWWSPISGYKLTNSGSTDISLNGVTIAAGDSVYVYPGTYSITSLSSSFTSWSPSSYFENPNSKTTILTMPATTLSILAITVIYIYTADQTVLQAIDPSTMTAKYSVTLPANVTAIGYDGTNVYAGLANGSIYKYSAELVEITSTSTITVHLNALTWNGQYLIAGSDTGIVYLLDQYLALKTQIDLATYAGSTFQVTAILWTGSYNYVVCGGPGSLSSSYVFLLGMSDLSVIASKNVTGGS